ncbi:hypothetical protein [Candidatus Enterovibrio escicola]|nr:hypothetical protein [Candidatus Enterovibrio escacola]
MNHTGTALGMIRATVLLSTFLSPMMVSITVHLSDWADVFGIVGLSTLIVYLFLMRPKKKSKASTISVAG